MADVSILNWLDNVDEVELRKQREAEELRLRKLAWENAPQDEKDNITRMVVEHSHRYGYDYVNKKRCYCEECRVDRDWLDEYYNEKGEW